MRQLRKPDRSQASQEEILENSFNSTEYNIMLCTKLNDAIELLDNLTGEISRRGTFETLDEIVSKKEEIYREIKQLYQKETELREKLKALRLNIKYKETEGLHLISQGKQTIAHLKGQVQEMKAKTIMEEKFATHYSTAKLEQMKHQCETEQNGIKSKIMRVLLMQEREDRVAEETRSYMHDRVDELRQREEFWQNNSDQNIQELRYRLEILKTSKARDLAQMCELKTQYQDHESVVLNDRIAKEKARQAMEKKEMEDQASLKIQNWWRCVLVRRHLQPRKKKKSRKTKKARSDKIRKK
ncbi:unnamed protein product [Dicrocoelium dendriticum]|nr:unnamed protein product [Dicrocoelium dendriticum]